eukprot:1141025-Rhodomonas_salina.1
MLPPTPFFNTDTNSHLLANRGFQATGLDPDGTPTSLLQYGVREVNAWYAQFSYLPRYLLYTAQYSPS